MHIAVENAFMPILWKRVIMAYHAHATFNLTAFRKGEEFVNFRTSDTMLSQTRKSSVLNSDQNNLEP